jgi:O-antigen/teichoic acid export membrane protein
MAEETVAHKTARTSLWGAVEKMSVMGVSFIVSLILARLLTPSDYGTIAMLTIFIAISDQFVACGFANALIRKGDCKSIDYNTAFWFNIGIGLLLYLLLYLVAPWVALFYNMEILCPVLRACGLSIPIGALHLVQNAILSKKLKAKKSALINLSSSLFSGIMGIGMALHEFGVWSLVGQQLSYGLLTALLLWLSSDWYPRFEFSRESMRYLWSFGSKMLLTGIISSFYGNIYSIVIGKYYDKSLLGVFNRGHKLATLFPGIAETVFVKNSLPIMSQLQGDRERLIHVYRELVKLTCFLTFPAVFLIGILAEPFVRLVLTEKWIDSVVYIQIFAVASLYSPANSVNLNLLQTFGRSDYTLKAEVIKKSISIVAVFLLLPFGTITLALGSSAMSILAYSVNLYYAKKLSGLSFRMQLMDVAPILLCTMIMVILVVFAIQFIDSNIVKLCFGGIIGVLSYFCLSKFVFKMDIYNQISNLRNKQG